MQCTLLEYLVDQRIYRHARPLRLGFEIAYEVHVHVKAPRAALPAGAGAKEADEKADAEFIGTGPYDVQVKIAKGELDGQKAMKEGSFKTKYFLFKAARYSKTLAHMGEVARTLNPEY